MGVVNRLIKDKNPLKVWCSLDKKTKHMVIRQIFGTNHKKNAELVRILLKEIIEDEKKSKRDIHGYYVNLLCIALAKTHEYEYLKDIVNAKSYGLFFHIDSNLIFEFSPKGERETCVKDTLESIKNVEIFSIKEHWYKTFCIWAKHYGKLYDERVVKSYWEYYKSDEFKNMLDDVVKYM